MNFMKINFRILFFLLFFNINFLFSSDSAFIDSFIRHYEFNAEGRYAHEYHPALLNKTATSLDELEEKLKNNGLNLSGRIVICGYEQEAVPSYYPDFKRAKINDEMNLKNKTGWSKKQHNRFGLMTGFLFKDFNYFSAQWYKDKAKIFEHIDEDDIEVFDERAEIFQRHAFSQALNFMFPVQYELIKKLKNNNIKGIFQDLIYFWDSLYKGDVKVEERQVAGTQDILFSIEYAKHLLRSDLQLFKFFVGPDITYPIEVSCSQAKDATLHAQKFVKTILPKLIAQEEKATVYIFCSFVDGVGKSTMLGNIKNFIKHGNNIEDFERVDNSSSQLAEIFNLKDNVFIADLPAQVSHFTYKPDGLVYVSVLRELSENKIKELQKFVRENNEKFKEQYNILLDNVRDVIKISGYFDKSLNNTEAPDKTFLKNLFLLKKIENNKWIPFCYEDNFYLFDSTDFSQIRVLMPLGSVQSEGLKNIESEQMLFFDGIRFPFVYDYFVQDLINKLKINNIENIVFVDFISMYPRSSRENIRVNYLLQQMALLDDNFDVKYSVYRDFVNSSELLYLLKDNQTFKKILNAFDLEILLRFALYNIILKQKNNNLEGFSLKKLTKLVNEEISKISKHDLDFLKKLSFEKVKKESIDLEKIYGLFKNFVNIQQFSFFRLLEFNDFLINFFTKNFENQNLGILWQNPGKVIADKTNFYSQKLDKILQTNSGQNVYSYFCFDHNCKDTNLLTPFIRMIRANWYASVINLLDLKIEAQDCFFLEKEKYSVVPLIMSFGTDNKFYLNQRILDEWQQDCENKILSKKKSPNNQNNIETLFNLNKGKKNSWAEFDSKRYRIDWRSLGTNSGIFAFDCNMASTKKAYQNKSIITFIVQKYQKEFGQDSVMPTSILYEKLQESFLWRAQWNYMLKQAEQNGEYGKNKEQTNNQNKVEQKNKDNNKQDNQEQNAAKKNQVKIYLANQDQILAAQLVVRLLSTLEMVIKDPDADIVVRFENKEDFKAALKLFEKIILPKYFGILFKQDLFDNYDLVEPVTELL
ncbi:hypothetical protein K9L05_03405 [Candidatus Babeliales bacterium]|nr:hypothetical protein [Candidatus Babeliales bacterium]